jgi:hypothetical protein
MSCRKLDSLSGKEVDDMTKVDVLRRWAKLGIGQQFVYDLVKQEGRIQLATRIST